MQPWLTRVRSIGNKFRTLIWPQLAKRSPGDNTFLLLLPLVGLAVGLTSVVTAHIISFLQNLLSAAVVNPWPLRIVIPRVGGLLVALIGWFFRVQTRGGGITTIMQAV